MARNIPERESERQLRSAELPSSGWGSLLGELKKPRPWLAAGRRFDALEGAIKRAEFYATFSSPNGVPVYHVADSGVQTLVGVAKNGKFVGWGE